MSLLDKDDEPTKNEKRKERLHQENNSGQQMSPTRKGFAPSIIRKQFDK